MADKSLQEIFQEEGMTGETQTQTESQPDQQTQSDQTNQSGEDTTTDQTQDTQTQDTQSQDNQTQTDQTDQQTSESEEGQTQTDQTEQTQTEGEEDQTQQPSEEQIVNAINSSLQTQFQSVEDIKELLSTKQQVDTYKQQLQEKDEALKNAGDPYQTFANEKVAKANEILRNNSDIPENVAFQLATQDFDNLSDDDVLVLSEIKDNPNWQGQESMVKKMLDRDYGLTKYSDQDEDLSQEQQEEIQIAKMRKQSDAQAARKELKKMADVEPPQQKDVEGQYKQTKEQQQQEQKQKVEQARPVANSMIERDLDKVQVGDKEKVEFEIDKSFKDFLKENDYLAQYLANNHDPNDPNSYQKAVDKVKQLYLVNNVNKIVDDAVKSERTRMQDQYDKQAHNPKEKNYQERPQQTDTDRKNQESESEMMQRLGI